MVQNAPNPYSPSQRAGADACAVSETGTLDPDLGTPLESTLAGTWSLCSGELLEGYGGLTFDGHGGVTVLDTNGLPMGGFAYRALHPETMPALSPRETSLLLPDQRDWTIIFSERPSSCGSPKRAPTRPTVSHCSRVCRSRPRLWIVPAGGEWAASIDKPNSLSGVSPSTWSAFFPAHPAGWMKFKCVAAVPVFLYITDAQKPRGTFGDGWGFGFVLFDSRPTWPLSLRPQQLTVAEESTTHVW